MVIGYMNMGCMTIVCMAIGCMAIGYINMAIGCMCMAIADLLLVLRLVRPPAHAHARGRRDRCRRGCRWRRRVHGGVWVLVATVWAALGQ